MSNPTALASMRQENFTSLRSTIEALKRESSENGSTRTIARAFDIIELILRAQEERLKDIEAVARRS